MGGQLGQEEVLSRAPSGWHFLGTLHPQGSESVPLDTHLPVWGGGGFRNSLALGDGTGWRSSVHGAGGGGLERAFRHKVAIGNSTRSMPEKETKCLHIPSRKAIMHMCKVRLKQFARRVKKAEKYEAAS